MKSPILDDVFRHALMGEISLTCKVGVETVVFKFKLSISALERGANPTTLLGKNDPVILYDLTEEVRLLVKGTEGRGQQSAVFPVKEVVAILGNKWPDAENITQIRRSVADRKAYPMPGYTPPPEKSVTAQGQTKKPGSHSESRHG
jgi:hypothetical protein